MRRDNAKFQSSPVLWDGRYQQPARHPQRFHVSILARPVGRALRHAYAVVVWSLVFQSSPVLWDGRYVVVQFSAPRILVSILARPVGRALQVLTVANGCIGLFQSSPVLWDGCYSKTSIPGNDL